MSIKKRHTKLLINKISNLKENEIEYCRSKIILLEKLMIDYPSRKIHTVKYQNYLRRLKLLLNLRKELQQIKACIYLGYI